MNILVNAVAAKSGGAATYAINLAKQVARAGGLHRYIFYLPCGLAQAIGDISHSLTIVETPASEGPAWKRFLWDQVTLRKIVKREHIDVLISSSDFGMFLPPCLQVLLIRNSLFFSQLYLRTLAVRQSWLSQANLLLRRRHVLLSAWNSEIVMTASNALLEEVQRCAKGRLGTIVVNPFGVPLDRFQAPPSHAPLDNRSGCQSSFRLLHVSEYCDYKNVTVLLKAIRILSSQGATDLLFLSTANPWQYPEVHVVTREEDQALAVHHQVASFVKFTGPIPYDDVPRLYRDSDLFVFPSLAESFGHPLVEAMASGLPILASDIPICREICEDAAVYFDPLDATDLAEKILRLRDNSILRGQLSANGRRRAKTQFDWNNHVHRLIELIEQVAVDT